MVVVRVSGATQVLGFRAEKGLEEMGASVF